VGTLRSRGEGGCASEGSALRSVWRGTTACKAVGLHDRVSLPTLKKVARALGAEIEIKLSA
jgi:hypothetical protein